jgi:raffinose/stachyose/melibiose transport system permease protein
MKSERTVLSLITTLLKWVFLLFLLATALLPLVWLLLNSFKTNLELQVSPFSLPAKFSLENYRNAIALSSLPRLFLNSIIVAFGTVVLNLLVTSMAGFVLARETFKGKGLIHTLLTAGILIPIIAFMVPYFTLVTKLGLYDKLITLILVYSAINIPVSIFIITAFMKAIPREMEEAAIIDGCGFAQRFTKVIFPLARSGIVTAGTFCFIYAWNEFIMAMLLTSSLSARTIQLGIRFFTSQYISDYTGMFAAIVLSIVPSVIIYVLLHDRIISGLSSGAVKG